MTYDEAVAWLYSTQLHGIKLGLENIRRLLAALSVELRPDPSRTVFHVAGTNGKGSTCAMLDAVCRAADLRTGLFTSPHLVTFRERLRLNGAMIPEEEVAVRVARIHSVVSEWETVPTFFELTTALGLDWFWTEAARAVILETGMGGRLDATNVIAPSVSIITPIAMDHQQWLGTTIAEIASEKAGIIKPGVPVVSGPQPEEALCFLMHIAAERSAPFHLVREPYSQGAVGLCGSHQRWNAALAVRALKLSGVNLPDGAMERGLAEVHWPGRFHRMSERCVLDGAHNPAAARQLASTWREIYGDEKATLILGVLKDKDLAGICAALLPIASKVFAVPVPSARSSAASEVAEICRDVQPDCSVVTMATLNEALMNALLSEERILVSGSLFLVGEAMTILTSTLLRERSAQ